MVGGEKLLKNQQQTLSKHIQRELYHKAIENIILMVKR